MAAPMTLLFPRWLSVLMLRFDYHELHHMYPYVPGYHLGDVQYETENEIGLWQWIRGARGMRGEIFLFHNRLETGADRHHTASRPWAEACETWRRVEFAYGRSTSAQSPGQGRAPEPRLERELLLAGVRSGGRSRRTLLVGVPVGRVTLLAGFVNDAADFRELRHILGESLGRKL